MAVVLAAPETRGRRFVDALRSPAAQLTLIVIVAAAFRFWAIDRFPPGLFGDEAAEGLDALDVLAGRGAVFFPANYGREGLYIWLVAGSIKLFGVTPFATRLPAILLGIATCALTWLMARELIRGLPQRQDSRFDAFLRAWGPFVAGLLLATSYWHVHFSRFSQRTILTPFGIGLAVWGFWAAVNTGRIRWWAVAGLGIGLTLHSYSVGRFFPVFVALFLTLDWLLHRRSTSARPILSRHWRGILLMIALSALIFAPLAHYFLTHPGSFFQRASAVATYANAGALNTLATIGRAALANLAQYVIPGAGDQAQFHNLPGRPVFEPLTALLALIGFGWCLTRPRQPVALFLLLWVAVMTLPAALATDRFPTLPRMLGVLPGLVMFPTLGLAVVAASIQRLAQRSNVAPALAAGLVALTLLISAVWTWRDYFHRWGPSPVTFDAFDGDMVAAWRWMQAAAPTEHVYLSSDIYRHPTYMYLGERATVTTYFDHANPNLSWFDARSALPLPPSATATYLIGASAPLSDRAAALMAEAKTLDVIRGPDDSPALTVLQWSGAQPRGAFDLPFGDDLALIDAGWVDAAGAPLLALTWRTAGPVPADWGGYQLEFEADGQTLRLPFDAFRAPEWVSGGQFITWHALDAVGRPADLSLRLLRAEDGRVLGAQTVSPR